MINTLLLMFYSLSFCQGIAFLEKQSKIRQRGILVRENLDILRRTDRRGPKYVRADFQTRMLPTVSYYISLKQKLYQNETK